MSQTCTHSFEQATKVCFDLTTQCYNTAPPTGSKGCRIWEEKCNGIRDACNAGNFDGPPQKGKVLTPGLPGKAQSDTQKGSSSAAPNASSSLSKATSTHIAPTPKPSSSAPQSASALKVSLDGHCGEGQTCKGSAFGDCCSKHSWCGRSAYYCGDGCQSEYGTCGVQTKSARQDANGEDGREVTDWQIVAFER